MAEAESGFFRGAGGGIFELPLPLSENFQSQLTRGQLTRVSADGSQYEEPADDDAEPAEPAEPAAPAKSAVKDEWIGYARSVDPDLSIDDADAMTKNDLIEKYGPK